MSESRILWRHAFKPTIFPVVSFLGPAAAALLTGSLVVEQIFGLPGVGRYFVQGAVNREYTLVSFFRQFELGERVDQDGIRAELKQGVLTLTLPKAAKAQPRAITVNAA